MRTTRLVRAAALVGLLLLALPGLAQFRVQPLSDQGGEVGLGLLLRRLGTVGVFMQATAHPDDEYNAQLVMYARGMGYRTILATATRGDGGQNEIGPELFDALAVLRTEELESMHRFDGAEQYFTRAVDFGFTVSLDETFAKWGRDEITGDYVRLIRMLRPDVITGLPPQAAGLSHQHHPASAQLSRDAYLAAGDSSRYPEQLKEGLRPWQAKKYYFMAGFGPGGGGRGRGAAPPPAPGFCQVETAVFDSLLGRTYAEIGTEARSMHKCQGQAQLLGLPGPVSRSYQLVESTIPGQRDKIEQSLFDGVDTTIGGLAQYVRGQRPRALVDGLTAIAVAVQDAQAKFTSAGPEAATPALASGLSAVRTLRGQLSTMGLDDAARYEIDERLQLKEGDFQRALVVADGMRIEVLADDGVVVAGQPVTVTVISAVSSKTPVSLTAIAFSGFDGRSACKPAPVMGIYRCETVLTVPANARMTAPYWKQLPDAARYEFEPDAPFGLPFRPTPFRARLDLNLNGTSISVDQPVEYRYEGDIASGEKRMELQVVPALAVKVMPEIAILPAANGGAAPPDREMRVTVINGNPGPATGEARVVLPAGWRSQPEAVPVTFSRADEAQTARFVIQAPAQTPPGAYAIRAIASSGGRTFDHGYQVVEYPHTRRRDLDIPAVSTFKVIDVKMAPGLKVGYVMGTGDQVPQAITQLGATVTLVDSDELAWGDLGKYHTIILGVRAYEKRDDLRAHNDRLLDYVQRGGTLIVQYNRGGEFNREQYAPFPVKVTSNRVTDENAPVTLLVPKHPLFTSPNVIDDTAWNGWVQERGTYFLAQGDPRYVDLLEIDEPFLHNRGLKRGALVEARVGKGRWIYLGLGLWRQLPAGTTGAYQLLANLISLGTVDNR
jgi:GlcNAc-PI de-N-acetylase/NPCBM-associated, NEW3 domain of alpha-galactosidase